MTIKITQGQDFILSTNSADVPLLKDLFNNTFSLFSIDVYGYGNLTFIPLKQFDDVLRKQIIETIDRIERNIEHLEKCLSLHIA